MQGFLQLGGWRVEGGGWWYVCVGGDGNNSLKSKHSSEGSCQMKGVPPS